ncbi:MAG: OmpA family protein [Syntrophobacteraceae bacterium]|jgi:outer membrane protein OmpA-like peptidoglycan-associated protein|nr:OmpA family protein [Syntrophobacteraceae bacterium]
MKKNWIALCAVTAFLMSACAAPATRRDQGALIGVGVGAATGAALGQAIGRSTGATVAGALAGAAVGGLAGGMIGNYMDQQEREFQMEMARMQGASMQRQGDNLAITFRTDVLFDVGSYRLKPGAYDEIDRVAGILNRYPETRVDISGHTDSTGSEQSNYTLSEARARAVADALADAGVNPRRVSARGFGESRPIASNATESGRQLNRRVVLDIIPVRS